MDLPLALRSALESGSVTLFLGAGIGKNATRPDGTAAPTGDDLAKAIARHFGVTSANDVQLAKIAEVVEYCDTDLEERVLGNYDELVSQMAPS